MSGLTRAVPLVAAGVVAGAVGSAIVAGSATHVTGGRTAGEAAAGTTTAATTRDRARAFLDRYVDDTGRVVRLDQGGDTVSEGQAYAMLIALGIGDRSAFDRIWSWTRANLQRRDGLLSWHWRDGAVVDPQSAADADLDAARALVLAGRAFGRSGLTVAGKRLGTAILDRETVRSAVGRLLLPGPWAARTPPYLVNPSYFSPVSARVLHRATGDRRWQQLEIGGRTVISRLAPTRRLVPDWASVGQDGSVHASTGPSGEPVVHGLEAARVPLRQVESCASADRTNAASQRLILERDADARAVDDLQGHPVVAYSSALSWSARSAVEAAAGRRTAAAVALADADVISRRVPTYYGDAWQVLARMMLTTSRLGGCPLGVGR
ncbi:glycosyl hydrolase family 8 [Nocardioides montaniterrae]